MRCRCSIVYPLGVGVVAKAVVTSGRLLPALENRAEICDPTRDSDIDDPSAASAFRTAAPGALKHCKTSVEISHFSWRASVVIQCCPSGFDRGLKHRTAGAHQT